MLGAMLLRREYMGVNAVPCVSCCVAGERIEVPVLVVSMSRSSRSNGNSVMTTGSLWRGFRTGSRKIVKKKQEVKCSRNGTAKSRRATRATWLLQCGVWKNERSVQNDEWFS